MSRHCIAPQQVAICLNLHPRQLIFRLEAVHDRLFDIFIPFSPIPNSPIPRKITSLRHSPLYSPASPPGRLHGTNIAKIISAEQRLLCLKELCTNVAIQEARSKHSHTAIPFFTFTFVLSLAFRQSGIKYVNFHWNLQF